jgi:tetratricopeptide (TPR) repeat protein
MRCWRLAASIALAGCAAFEGRHPDESWQKVTSPHFVLWTDFDEKTAQQAATVLEDTRDALVSAAWPERNFADAARTEVFVLTEGFEFERLFGPKTDGVYLQRPRPAFYLYGEPDRWQTLVSLREAPNSRVRHEMAHLLAAQVFAHEPKWFAEGFAEYFETLRYSDDGQSVLVGAKNASAMRMYMRARSVTLRAALGWTGTRTLSETETAGMYGTSWLFVHWLFATRPAPFARYRSALASGIDAATAWSDSFPGFDVDAANLELYHYAKFDRFDVKIALPARRHTWKPTAEAVGAATGHVARARLAFASSLVLSDNASRLLEAQYEVARALELDPGNVDALAMDLWEPLAARLARARLTAAAHPDDPRASMLLARIVRKVQPGTDEAESAYRRALALDPDDAEALHGLAETLLDKKQVPEALALAQKAVKRAPNDSVIADTCAVALFWSGQCPAAIEQELRALELLRDAPVPAAQLADFTRHLSEFRTSCGTAAR